MAGADSGTLIGAVIYGMLANHVLFVDIHDTEVNMGDLIQNGRWNLSNLYTVVPEHLNQSLLRIAPRLVNGRGDAWTWDESSTGRYTVKDAYAWLNARNRVTRDDRRWDWLWKLRVPEKMRFFIWIVLQNGLQTNEHRWKCGMAASPNCSRCSAQVENLMHCLRDCPHSREVWNRMGALRWRNFLRDESWGWVHDQARGANGLKFLVTLWGIWKWRNNMLFETSPWTIDEAWRRICHDIDESKLVQSQGSMDDRMGWMSARWELPPTGVIKLNCDGSYREDQELMGAGGVFRDDQGRWLLGFQNVSQGGNAFEAEAMALRDGLELAWVRGFRNIICEVDSRELLGTIQNTEVDRFVPMVLQIRSMLERPWRVEMRGIHRECNHVADFIAKTAVTVAGYHIMASPCHELETLIMRDLLGVS